MVRPALIVSALAVAASAEKVIGHQGKRLRQANLLPVGLSPQALNLGLAGTCEAFSKTCDSQFCIPTTAICCNDGNGAYCKLSETCVPKGCCPIGKRCTGPTTCESSSEKVCGTFCIPEDAECCDEDDGTFCDDGSSCTSTGCSGGGSQRGGGSGGSGSSSDSDSDSDSSSSSSNSSGGSSDDSTSTGSDEQCYSFQEECGDGCMPKGSVCCEKTQKYCFAGQTCNSDGTCSGGLRSGGDPEDYTGLDDSPSAPASSDVTIPTLDIPIPTLDLPTGPRSGDDGSGGDDDEEPFKGGPGKNDEPDAAVAHGPSFAAAFVALAALFIL